MLTTCDLSRRLKPLFLLYHFISSLAESFIDINANQYYHIANTHLYDLQGKTMSFTNKLCQT